MYARTALSKSGGLDTPLLFYFPRTGQRGGGGHCPRTNAEDWSGDLFYFTFAPEMSWRRGQRDQESTSLNTVLRVPCFGSLSGGIITRQFGGGIGLHKCSPGGPGVPGVHFRGSSPPTSPSLDDPGPLPLVICVTTSQTFRHGVQEGGGGQEGGGVDLCPPSPTLQSDSAYRSDHLGPPINRFVSPPPPPRSVCRLLVGSHKTPFGQ